MWILSISSSSTYFGSPTIRSHHPHPHGSNLNLSHLHNHKSLSFPTSKKNLKNSTSRRNMAIYSADPIGVPPFPPFPDTPSFRPLWVAGVVLSAILSIWKTKNYWRPFLMLKEKVEAVVDAAEEVAEMAETAADRVDKVAEEIAEHLPDGSELQKTAQSVEDAAKKIGKDADLVGHIFDKIETVEDELSSLIEHSGESKEEDDPKQKKE